MEFRKHKRIKVLKLGLVFAMCVLAVLVTVFSGGCGNDKIIIRYLKVPPAVALISPPIDTFITVNQPAFLWHAGEGIVRYQLQVSPSQIFMTKTIDITTSDTTYTTISQIPNSTYFWRVRGQNQDTTWGDWSDADVWSFFKSDYVNYIDLLSTLQTYGIPQDVTLRGDTAYVADGQADLTIVDVSDKANPFIIKNIDTFDDDFAKGVYIAPIDTFPYAYVADRDGRVQVINTADTSRINDISVAEQNLEDVDGHVISDTLYLFTVRSRSGFNIASLSIFQIVYTPYPRTGDLYFVNPVSMPSDPKGLVVDGNYVYVACGDAGLRIVDISDIYDPRDYSSLYLGGVSLSVAVKGDYAYVADDRSGLVVVNIADKANPVAIAQVNTSGRSKDVHIAGDYAFIADGSGGLKVVDLSVPDSSHFVAAYPTPYAYGVWADSANVYICDRDEGLLIFENKVSK